MKKIVIATILTLTFLGQTFACINGETTILKHGLLLYEDAGGYVHYGHSFTFPVLRFPFLVFPFHQQLAQVLQ